MDINDIRLRLGRICSALNSRFDGDYNKHARVEFIGNGGVSVTLPGKDDKNTIDYNILSILHQLATPKDHLKKCLERKGHDPKIVEDAINVSFV